jgi:acetyl esterase/lipase
MNPLFAISLLALAAIASMSACSEGRPELYPDVTRAPHPYGYHYHRTQSEPLTEEMAPQAKRILLVHGGGLLVGSPRHWRFDELSRNLATHGFEVLSLEYPLLWQGLTLEKGGSLVHCALASFAGEAPVAIVGISAGAWLSSRALALPAPPGCENHPRVDRYAAISPMLNAQDAWGPWLIASWFERTFSPPEMPRSQLPERLLIIHGQDDWLVPEPTSRKLCADPKAQHCRRHVISGGHFLIGDGLPGSPEMGEQLWSFLAAP